MADKTLFELKDISVQFGGLRASDHVSFDVKEGEIFGLIGPNGACACVCNFSKLIMAVFSWCS